MPRDLAPLYTMFKYVSNILKTISPAQRVMALSMLLVSITLIAIGPKIVNSFTQDTEELKNKVELQRQEIDALTLRVSELNKQVIDNQTQCTNEIVSRQREMLAMITEIEAEALKTGPRKLNVTQERYATNNGGENGEERMMMMPAPAQVIEVPVVNPKMVSLVKKFKKDIQKDINGKQ